VRGSLIPLKRNVIIKDAARWEKPIVNEKEFNLEMNFPDFSFC
jgi:hypothetical protein